MGDRASVTTLFVSNKGLETLDIGEYVNLEELYCSGNQLKSLDVSKCVNLKELYCHGNQLTAMDVSKCANLKELSCNKNQLAELDVSKCVNLKNLWCHNNKLTSLDVSKCVNLEFLNCSNNGRLWRLAAMGTKKLQRMYIKGTPLLSWLETEALVEIETEEGMVNRPRAQEMAGGRKASVQRAIGRVQWWAVEARYRPGGNGYINSLESFEKRIKTGFKQ